MIAAECDGDHQDGVVGLRVIAAFATAASSHAVMGVLLVEEAGLLPLLTAAMPCAMPQRPPLAIYPRYAVRAPSPHARTEAAYARSPAPCPATAAMSALLTATR